MKNITIGRVAPDWTPAATARYYAERGYGEDYAFGPTPSAALTRLEKREAAKAPSFDAALAEEIAFLALGAADFLRERHGVCLDRFNGYMGLIHEVICHAPMLSERWERMDAGEFGGVWLYDVTERFGREWAEALLDKADVSPSEHLESIIEDEMGKWE